MGVQTVPQPPQLFTSWLTSFSQPFWRLSSQSAKPASHVIWQADSAQNGAPLTAGQVAPHAPQLAASVLVFTSQPSLGSPLQSANGGMQLSTLHTPPAHAATPLGSEHGVAQSPQ